MAMGADFDAVVTDSFENEIGIARVKLIEAFLDDMVSIEILNKLDNTVA